MFNAFLSDIIHKSCRNSFNRPTHEAKVHDIMEFVDAINFITSGVLYCTINLECVPKDCLWAEVTVTITSVIDRLAALERDIQQLKSINEPEATNVSKLAPKDSAPFINNKDPIITTSHKQISQCHLRVRKQQPYVDKDGFQLVQYKKHSVYSIRKDVKPISELRIASLFFYRVNKDIQENDIRYLLDCANIKVLNICVLSHELA